MFFFSSPLVSIGYGYWGELWGISFRIRICQYAEARWNSSILESIGGISTSMDMLEE